MACVEEFCRSVCMSDPDPPRATAAATAAATPTSSRVLVPTRPRSRSTFLRILCPRCTWSLCVRSVCATPHPSLQALIFHGPLLNNLVHDGVGFSKSARTSGDRRTPPLPADVPGFGGPPGGGPSSPRSAQRVEVHRHQ